MKLALLDLFCGAGGCSKGYHDAGFEVTGVDINPQPHYPYHFIQMDVLMLPRYFISEFDALHASPPCQAYSNCSKISSKKHPELIASTRVLMQSSGKPYVIENVEGSPLINPALLCGTMFGLPLYRHRLFEASFPIASPEHPAHIARQAKMGRPPADGEFVQVVGHFSCVSIARKSMEIDWMSRDEMAQAIPPAYTKYIGEQLMKGLA